MPTEAAPISIWDQRATQDLGEATRLDPELAQAYFIRALAYTFLGNDAEASQDIDEAMEMGFDRAILEQAISKIKKQR